MKYIIILVLVLVSFTLGWSFSQKYVSPKASPVLDKAIPTAEIAAQKQQELLKKKQTFIQFLESTEKKYSMGSANITPIVFSHYLEDIVRQVFKDSDNFQFISFQYPTIEDNLLTIKDQLANKKTNNYSSISSLIESINFTGSEINKFSKEECRTYLNDQKDL
jgi:hypothetical protein